MGQKLYSQDETGIKFSSQRKPGEVRIPNYVYDIWLPILGSDALAIYAVYCRLEMKGAVKKIKLVDIARACRIGKTKLNKINDKLETCGFIKINKPIGEARLMHWTTEVIVLDPPRKVAQKLIDKYAPNYEILTPWLLGDKDQIDPPEDPNGPSGEPEQAPPEDLDQPPKIATLDSLQPLEVVERETPSLREQAQAGEMTNETELNLLLGFGRDGKAGVADPSQDIAAYMEYASEFMDQYYRITSLRPAKSQKHKIETLANRGAGVTFWGKVVDAWVGAGWNPRNIDGMIDYYERGEIPSTGKNGGKNATNHQSRRVSGSVPKYTVADPAAFGGERPDDEGPGKP